MILLLISWVYTWTVQRKLLKRYMYRPAFDLFFSYHQVLRNDRRKWHLWRLWKTINRNFRLQETKGAAAPCDFWTCSEIQANWIPSLIFKGTLNDIYSKSAFLHNNIKVVRRGVQIREGERVDGPGHPEVWNYKNSILLKCPDWTLLQLFYYSLFKTHKLSPETLLCVCYNLLGTSAPHELLLF